VPEFKKPGAVVVIRPPGKVPVAVDVQAHEHDDGPSLDDPRQQLAALPLTEPPEHFVFDMTYRSRWAAVDHAIEQLRASAMASAFAAEDAFIPAARRRKGA
jgi:hypothetical protein